MNDLMAWLREDGRWFAVIILGICGGCIQSANDPDISFRRFVIGFITAGFVSVLTALLLLDLDMSFSIKAVIIGLSGYSAAKTLEVLNRFFLKKLEKLEKITEDAIQIGKDGKHD